MSSTSNIKPSVSIRQGFIQNWTEDSSALNDFSNAEINSLSLIKWELARVKVTPLQLQKVDSIIQISYYKWLQTPFISKRLRKSFLVKRRTMKNSKALIGFKVLKVRSKTLLIGKQRLTKRYLFWLRRRHKVDNWLRKRQKYKKDFSKLQLKVANYEIPVFVIWNMQRSLFNNNQLFNFEFMNVYKLTRQLELISKNKYDVIGMLRSASRIKYLFDLVNVQELISLRLCGVYVLNTLLSAALARNSSKSTQLQFLRYLKKLPTMIHVNQSAKQCRWVAKITGKIGGATRTRSLYVRPRQLPLHSIGVPVEYQEGFSNTKYGTFSIKLWLI